MNNPSTDQQAGIADILGTVHALHILCPSTDFREWCSKCHWIEPSVHLFNGYIFTVRTLTRMLHHSIAYNYSLQLSEDFVFSRARFYGVPLARLPHTCEKGTLTKNIHYLSRTFLGAKSWDQFDEKFNTVTPKLLKPFDDLALASKVNPSTSTENLSEAMGLAARHKVHTFLNNTRRRVPLGYLQAMLEDNGPDFLGRPSPDYLGKVFPGYKLAVQFLWYRLLGDMFEPVQLAAMHTSADWVEFDEYFNIIRDDMPN